MDYEILPELRDYLPIQTPEENAALTAKIIAEGPRAGSLVVGVLDGRRILIDGHHTRAICLANDISLPEPKVLTFDDMDDIKAEMRQIQFSRRNTNDETRAYLIGEEYNYRKNKLVKTPRQNDALPSETTAEKIASEVKTSPRTVQRDAAFADAVNKIGEADPAAKTAILAGTTTASKADVIAAGRVLCSRCTRLGSGRDGCEACAEAAAKAVKKPKRTKKATKTLSQAVAEDVSEPEEKPVDKWGIPITPEAAPAFADLPKFAELLDALKAARKLYQELAKSPGGAFLTRPGVSVNANGEWRHAGLETCILNVKDCKPLYTVCPYAYDADHEHTDKCNLCRGQGWTVAFTKSAAVPEAHIHAAQKAHGVELTPF